MQSRGVETDRWPGAHLQDLGQTLALHLVVQRNASVNVLGAAHEARDDGERDDLHALISERINSTRTHHLGLGLRGGEELEEDAEARDALGAAVLREGLVEEAVALLVMHFDGEEELEDRRLLRRDRQARHEPLEGRLGRDDGIETDLRGIRITRRNIKIDASIPSDS